MNITFSGCGTGKYLGLAPECFVVGSDSCTEFGAIAARRGHNVVACDNQTLPFRDSCFDAVISVGVIHHFASAKRRTKALEELYRILRPGGKMLVYVWAFEQDERKVCNGCRSVVQLKLRIKRWRGGGSKKLEGPELKIQWGGGTDGPYKCDRGDCQKF